MKYEPLPEWSREEMEAVIRQGDSYQVALVPLVAGLHPPDSIWAHDICARLAAHPDVAVRGNAILGFGYLAMTCGDIREDVVRPIIESGMHNTEDWIRSRSEDAADMCNTYMGWKFANSDE